MEPSSKPDGTLRERLVRIEEGQAGVIKELRATQESLDNLKEGMQRMFEGANGSPGFIVRLDRLEQTEKRREWLHKLALSASVVSLLTVLGELVAKVFSTTH